MTLRHVTWWTAVALLIVPALVTGLALTAVNRADEVVSGWWDDFHDWAYQGER